VTKKPFKLTPPDPSEDELQHSVARLFLIIFQDRPVVWSHIPSGGYYLSPAASARLYRLGLQPGLPDLMVWWKPERGFPATPRCVGIEMKTPTGRPSGTQRRMHSRLGEAGVPCTVCRSVEEVLSFLRYYNVPMKKVKLATINQGTAQGRAKEPAQGATQAART
jgi:hypothetical protein